MDSYEQARRIEARRAANPERERRRQQELQRMSMRFESIPTYIDTVDGRGRILASVYIAHVSVPIGRREGKSWKLFEAA